MTRRDLAFPGVGGVVEDSVEALVVVSEAVGLAGALCEERQSLAAESQTYFTKHFVKKLFLHLLCSQTILGTWYHLEFKPYFQ